MNRRVPSRRSRSDRALWIGFAKIAGPIIVIGGILAVYMFMTRHYAFFASPGGDYVLEARVYNYERWFGFFPAPGDSAYASGKVILRDRSGRVLARVRVDGAGFVPEWGRNEVSQPCRYYIRLPAPILAWNDKAYVLQKVREDGWLLIEASEELRDDEEVVKVAIQRDPSLLRFASPRLQAKLKKPE